MAGQEVQAVGRGGPRAGGTTGLLLALSGGLGRHRFGGLLLQHGETGGGAAVQPHGHGWGEGRGGGRGGREGREGGGEGGEVSRMISLWLC